MWLARRREAGYVSPVETGREWPQRVVTLIGQQIAWHRSRLTGRNGKRLTLAELADRTRDLGFPLDLAVISKLETGYRQTITVSELLVLAKALRVPPALLLFPVGHDVRVEALPGRHVDPWEGLKWFSGEGPFPAVDGAEGHLAPVTADTPSLFRRHDRLVSDYQAIVRKARQARELSVGEGKTDVERAALRDAAEAHERSAELVLEQLRGLRAQLRGLVSILPPAPVDECHRA
jgi:hypothetical protein